MRFGTVPFSEIKKHNRLDAEFYLKECCISCGRFIDGEDVKMGVKVDEGTGKMCFDCHLEKV